MKLIGVFLGHLGRPLRHRNVRIVLWLAVISVVIVVVATVLFQVIMAREDRDFSWASSVYWTLTTMSTLGFGDVTFQSDLGRVFSVVVLATGVALILVILPFAFIEFVFGPWMTRQEEARAPRSLPESTRDHVILTCTGVIEEAVVRRAEAAQVTYVVLVPDLKQALSLYDQGYKVMVGALDDPATYRAARVDQAAVVAATGADTANTNTTFTVREIDPDVPIVAAANTSASVDVLKLAGSTEVLQLGRMLGRAMANRVLGADNRAHVIGMFGDLRIAEASAADTDLVGTTLQDAQLRQRCQVNVVGVWERGEFFLTRPDTAITQQTVLIIAGSAEQLDSYNKVYGQERPDDTPVVVIGGGRVGRAAGEVFEEEGIRYRIVEQDKDRVRDTEAYIHGDAAELDVLEQAGLRDASAVLVTPHEDDINIYLTLYCRRLEADLQIISRANLDRNVSTLHRAGADAVLSYASIGATAIWNTLGLNDTLVLAEGLDVFRVSMPEKLVGKSLADAGIRQDTGCNVVAIARDGDMESNPDANQALPDEADLVLIGDSEAEQRFLQRFPSSASRRLHHRHTLPDSLDRL